MNRNFAIVGATRAVLALAATLLVSAELWGRVAPGYAVSQQFDTGHLMVELPHDVTHRFRFRNDRSESLEIVEIKPSCGCTKTEVAKRTLAPGETGWLEVTTSLDGSGAFSTSVDLQWSTGEKTTYFLSTFAQVNRDLLLSRGTIDLDIDESRTVVVTYIDQEGLEPGPLVLEHPEALEVTVAPWDQIIKVDHRYGIAARHTAVVQVRLKHAVSEVGRVNFALANHPKVNAKELVVRTPELIARYGQDFRPRRDRPLRPAPHAGEPVGSSASKE